MPKPVRKPKRLLSLGLLFLVSAGLASRPAAAAPIDLCLAIVGLGSCLTNSSAAVNEIQQSTIQQVDTTVSTRLIARMLNGPVLSDQTVNAGFGDSAVLALIAADESLLTLAGAGSFQGPSLATTITSNNFTTAVQNSSSTQQISGTRGFAGPVTVKFGLFGLCQGFTLDAGGYPLVSSCDGTPDQRNIALGQSITDTLTLTLLQTFVTTIVHNDQHITQIYDLIGIPADIVSVPEPPSFHMWAVTLIAFGFFGRLSKHARHRSSDSGL